MREQNPKLAKQSRVLRVTMDAVYDFAITGSPETAREGVTFRFMPDAREVASALQVRALRGLPACCGARRACGRVAAGGRNAAATCMLA